MDSWFLVVADLFSLVTRMVAGFGQIPRFGYCLGFWLLRICFLSKPYIRTTTVEHQLKRCNRWLHYTRLGNILIPLIDNRG